MPRPFFSDPWIGWLFYVTLMGLLAVAAVLDLRKAIIPKWLTLSMLGLGVLANGLRGALLASREENLWLLSTGTAWIGFLDGVLLALAGFALAFVVFFLMWILGACGGGDVKLFSALGAWVGPVLVPFLLLGSVVALAVLLVGKVLYLALAAPASLRSQLQSATVAGRQANTPARKRPLRMTYSLPVAIAAALLLLWFYRVELNLAPAKADSARTMVIRHDA